MKASDVPILTEGLFEEIEDASESEQYDYLILSESDEFPGFWLVEGFDPEFFYDFEHIIGRYRLVSPARLDWFLEVAEEKFYRVVFLEDPTSMIERVTSLDEPPPFSLNSNLEGTVNGFLPWQVVGFNKLIRSDIPGALAVWNVGSGKAQPLDSPILTPTGWTTMGQLRVGDPIIGIDGQSQIVLGIYPQGNLVAYRVMLCDGTSTIVSEDHLWSVEHWSSGSRKLANRRYMKREIKTTRELYEEPLWIKGNKKTRKEGRARWSVPSISAIEYQIAKPLPLDPYLMGVLLGDGGFTNSTPRLSTADAPLLEEIKPLLPTGVIPQREGESCDYRLSCGRTGGKENPLTRTLRNLGLWNHKSEAKFIPECYKYASIPDRIKLLQGLNDTDGSPAGCGVDFSVSSRSLAFDYAEVVRSLGGYCPTPKPRKTARLDSYRTISVIPYDQFRLARKQERVAPYRKRLRSIVSIEPLGYETPMQCIRVSNQDSLYLTSDFIPTHNTALAAAAIKWHLLQGNIDLALVVVKSHNKIETQRKFKQLGDIDSIIIEGDPLKRFGTYERLEESLKLGPTVAITNYEKFRDDEGIMDYLITKRRCLFIWDEFPTKLSNRKTQLYTSVKRALYKSFVSKPRPKWMRHLVLSATPIENDPDGLFSCLNLIYPRYLGTVDEFQGEYVLRRNFHSKEPEDWTNLDKIEAKIDFMTHRVNKDDPEVEKMFPSVKGIERIIDWNPKHRALYDRLTAAAKDLLKEEDGVNILSLIQVMQMLCDAPSMIKESANNRERFMKELMEGTDSKLTATGSEAAARLLQMVPMKSFTDVGHTKLEAWREIIVDKHPDSKIVTHSTWANYIFPIWHHWLDKWGITYVTYTGTDRQKQKALDAFRDDPSIRVFLSGDSGSDSIDIAEADVGVSYNGSWKWTTMQQREGRRDRVNSTFSSIYTYDLAMADSVEDRKRKIRGRKRSYHDAIFEGHAVESALSARMGGELQYLLLGETEDDYTA